MNIVVKKLLKTIIKRPGERQKVVPPGRYNLLLTWIIETDRDAFFFINPGFEDVFVGITMLHALKKVGMIECNDDLTNYF